MSEKRDYYEVLAVERTVDAAELKRAYRRMAMELHPDRNPGNAEAEHGFKEASEAYQVLSDPQKRAHYDRFGHAGPGTNFGGGAGFRDVGDIFSAFSDIFGDIFGGGGAGGRRGPARGGDIETRVSITLEEAATGVTKEITVLRNTACTTCGGTGAAPGSQPEACQHCGGRGQVMHSQGFLMISSTCPVCRGEGRVIRKPCVECEGSGVDQKDEALQISIPAGVENGSTLRLMGRGEGGAAGRAAGQPLCRAARRRRRALRTRRRRSAHRGRGHLSAAGARRSDLGADAGRATSRSRSRRGRSRAKRIPLVGHGMPRLGARGKGDVVAHLKLVVPGALSAEEDAHLRAYAAAGGQRVSPERGGFFRRKKKK